MPVILVTSSQIFDASSLVIYLRLVVIVLETKSIKHLRLRSSKARDVSASHKWRRR